MTCKDCYHYAVCEDCLKYIQERFLKEFTFCESYYSDGEFCNLFKDKSSIVELPCVEGENLYYISKNNTIGCFLNVSYETILMCVNDYHNGEIKFMATTREKAETRLKELNKNENA